MLRERGSVLLAHLRGELDRAVLENNTPREIAGSFSLGVFITAMPTLGTGMLAFVLLGYLFDSINKIALFASILVLNPVVKWGVYAGSVWLGILLLGPPASGFTSTASIPAGADIAVRLLVGNLIIAIVCTVLAYPIALRLVQECRRQNVEPSELPREILPD